MAAAMSRTRPTRRAFAPRPAAIAALVAAGKRRVLECVVIGPGPEVDHAVRRLPPEAARVRRATTLPIHLCGPDGLHRTVTLGQLLPMSFGPQHLGMTP